MDSFLVHFHDSTNTRPLWATILKAKNAFHALKMVKQKYGHVVASVTRFLKDTQ